MKGFLVLLGVFLLVIQLHGREVPDAPRKCHGVDCPEGTRVCKRVAESTDEKHVSIDVFCINEKGKILKENHTKEDNPTPSFHFQSVSIQAIFSNFGSTSSESSEEVKPTEQVKPEIELLDR